VLGWIWIVGLITGDSADPTFEKLTVGVLEIVLEKLTEGVGVLEADATADCDGELLPDGLADPTEVIDGVIEPDTVEVGVLDPLEEALFDGETEIETVLVAVTEPTEPKLLTEETDLLGDGVLEAGAWFGPSPHIEKSVIR
jgi:hypothetical protein